MSELVEDIMDPVEALNRFDSEDKCAAYLEKMRWPEGVRCLKCGNDRISRFLASGKTGKTRHLYQCLACRYQFSARTGTIFHDSHLPLRKWFAAIALLSGSRDAISANQLSRVLGVQYKTAWHLVHRIREAMEAEPALASLGAREEQPSAAEVWQEEVFAGLLTQTGRLESKPIPASGPLQAAAAAGAAQGSGRFAGPRVLHSSGGKTHWQEAPRRMAFQKSKPQVQAISIETVWGIFKREVFDSFPVMSARHMPGFMNEVTYLFGSQLLSAMPTGILCPFAKGLKRTIVPHPSGSGTAKE